MVRPKAGVETEKLVCPLCCQTVDAFYSHMLNAHGGGALDKALKGEFQPIKVHAEGRSTSDQKPPANIIVYYDGACEPRNPAGVATYGFVIYASGKKVGDGKGLAAEPWSERASNNVAEYTAMIRAFEWLLENGYAGAEVLVRGDSQLSIRQMQGLYAVNAPRIIPLYEESRKLASKFRKVKFKWVPREENMEADMLSELAFKEYWIEFKREKAAEIRKEEIKHVGGATFIVRKYKVDLEAYTCDCPDYKRANRNPRLRTKLPCKHLLAAQKAYAASQPKTAGTTAPTAQTKHPVF